MQEPVLGSPAPELERTCTAAPKQKAGEARYSDDIGGTQMNLFIARNSKFQEAGLTLGAGHL